MGHIPSVKIDAVPGELIDKITILEIKAERIDDAMKRANVTYELATLTNAMNLAIETSEQISALSSSGKPRMPFGNARAARISGRYLSISHDRSTA